LSNPAIGEFTEYSTEEVNRDREIVNDFIRNSGECYSVIEFDEAIRDPLNPDDLRDDLQSPDNLHPNEKGYQVMAETIDPSIFGKKGN
jgi:lysophospholipase L1-like esterase